ncbi:MAG: hypothetical protein A2096_01975 [Spirochaetes bacterium GWF1_41_5]|nr:MAG: hypothetical protein A2096_01975 [Spirochaetes bacterium GWF1_41_5]HBE02557.1 hypothetical protein [Spirochaetia bacterium]
MHKALLILDSETERKHVLSFIPVRHKIFEAGTCDDGIDIIKNQRPNFVLLGSPHIEKFELEFLQKTISLPSRPPIIIINFNKPQNYIIDCLNHGALNTIFYPDELVEIETLTSLYIELGFRLSDKHSLLLQHISREKKSITLHSADMRDAEISGFFLDSFFQSAKTIFSDSNYMGILNAVYEMLFNAYEHGNLHITSDEKEDALQKNNYQQLLDERFAVYQGTKIYMDYEFNRRRIKISIEDEGDGFNHDAIFEMLKLRQIDSYSGRGITIARHFFDSVDYNYSGNRVIMMKKAENEPHN